MEKQDIADSTIAYYEENSAAYAETTLQADLSALYDKFEKMIPAGGRILDLGCGSGRDSRHFIKAGYEVTAVDASQAMAKLAEKTAKIPVRVMKAEEINYNHEFDGIWACAVLLHVEKKKMQGTIERVMKALKKDGTAYFSWKYGERERMDGGRYFADYTEQSLRQLLKTVSAADVLDIWITSDTVPGRKEIHWVNALVKRK